MSFKKLLHITASEEGVIIKSLVDDTIDYPELHCEKLFIYECGLDGYTSISFNGLLPEEIDISPESNDFLINNHALTCVSDRYDLLLHYSDDFLDKSLNGIGFSFDYRKDTYPINTCLLSLKALLTIKESKSIN